MSQISAHGIKDPPKKREQPRRLVLFQLERIAAMAAPWAKLTLRLLGVPTGEPRVAGLPPFS
jgi:hypothetical protein